MALTAGTRLGPYEILSPLGAGGMGEVYRARDTRLGRAVAVKVLPEHLSGTPEVRQRFEREAKAVSSLNHPHICTLFDIGSHEGVDYLVMELLEGESLSLRLKKGPLTAAEALKIGVQIADALEKAHRAGFVHRDLKPGNIMLTKAGAKLLDFGLARSLAGGPVGPGSSGEMGSDPSSATPTVAHQLSAAPTAHSPLTGEGAILGTFQYMAPEQLEGREADQRTDIFAFGLVLYEMITGRRAFEAETQASLIAEILKGEPRKASEIAGTSPPALDRVIQTCLRKDPDDRFQSAHDVRLQLEWITDGSSAGQAASGVDGAAAAGEAAPPRRSRLPWVVAIAAVLVAVVGWKKSLDHEAMLAEAGKPVAFSVDIPAPDEAGYSQRDRWPDFAISPNGRKLVMVARDDAGVHHLWVRPMDSTQLRQLEATAGAENPFWSPDSRSIAFFAQSKLKKISAEGGTVQIICDSMGNDGGTWSRDGVILFGGAPEGGIMKVPDSGGVPEAVTTASSVPEGEGFPERPRHHWPVFLPDGRRFLFLDFPGRTSDRAIYIASLDGGEPAKLFKSGFRADFIEPDWVVYVQSSSLVARRIDLDTLELKGEPYTIVSGVDQALVPGMASFSVSPSGHIAYVGSDIPWQSRLTWYGRDGQALENVTGPGTYVSVSLSPDGKTVATARGTGDAYDGVGVGEAPVDLWNIDLERHVTTQFTARPGISDENPVWSPDGKRLAYASHRDGVAAVYVRDSSAAGAESLLLTSERNPHPIDWSPEGRYLLLHVADTLADNDLAYLDLENPGEPPVDWVTGHDNQGQGQFSPDGRWVAYTSYEGDAPAIFVRPFPAGEGKWQISSGGAEQPRWRDDGRELYYVAEDGSIMAVEIGPGPEFRASAPKTLIAASPVMTPGFVFYGGQACYDVAPGGRRFLINQDLSLTQAQRHIEILLNWPGPGT